MAIKIYLVEDEKNLNVLLKKYLELEGYEVTTFSEGSSAMKRINDMPDLWILDIMLPDIDGYGLIKAIKSKNKNTPVIFMSARNEELDRVVGLELGSDDYLSKPFLPRELVIRTNKLLERLKIKEIKEVVNEKEFEVEGYKINKKQRTVFEDGQKVQLTNKEFELLNYFIDNKNNLLSREQILITVWGNDYFGSDRVVDDTIRRLRKKMEGLMIETVYGYGYKLVIV
ncbi:MULTISPECIES: response regulator transcription factor [Clostridium]|uniref:Stage 0 sporulation protein A homolog n=1 Tax=Clostridium cibarium TaxID=2762247 RepID=A0ABR8PXD6_9CLOT|nr:MULTISPECIES: response regulator transcription factor [Clostridium]MBD7912802.1 response regulator transcription factor [Clostridium cibarium]